jgi:NAD+ diphosphatase
MPHTPILSVKPLTPCWPEPELSSVREKRWVVVQGQTVLVSSGPTPSVIFDHDLPLPGLEPKAAQYLGMLDGIPCYAYELPGGSVVPEGHSFSGVRDLYGKVPDPEMALASYAVRIIGYDRSTRFCGRCGHETRPLRTERAKLCTDCNLIIYPRISPAIIVLIKKGEEVLLASSPRFPPGLFSVIAGFVEPGESIEETVHREVKEEVGIQVKNIRYFASEPWPFPDSLMLGFVADYCSGDIVIDNNEIRAAGWFTRDTLPDLPSSMSISRALINAWIAREI